MRLSVKQYRRKQREFVVDLAHDDFAFAMRLIDVAYVLSLLVQANKLGVVSCSNEDELPSWESLNRFVAWGREIGWREPPELIPGDRDIEDRLRLAVDCVRTEYLTAIRNQDYPDEFSFMGKFVSDLYAESD